MSMATTEQHDDAAAAAPEIVSAFPLPPAFFVLYGDGIDSGPLPPAPMEPQYHMFGTPFSTQDVVPDLLPLPGQKLYLHGTKAGAATAAGAVVVASSAGATSVVAGEKADATADTDSAVLAADDATATTTATAAAAGTTSAADGSSGTVDFKREMKKINHSLLANFLELVDVLIKQPALFNEKLVDLELLFLNMHNLINTFRPHQARETILHMLQMQIQERRDAADDIRKTIDEARRTVEDVHGELHDHAIDEMRSQDAVDIKMEVVADDSDRASVDGAASGTGAAAASRTSGSAATTALGQMPGGHVTAKAHEVQQMQESFFSALQSIAGIAQ